MSAEVTAPDVLSVVVESSPEVVASIVEPAGVVVVTASEQGPPGPPGPVGPEGPPGNTNIDGFPLELEDLEVGDLLVFSGSSWINENKVDISDGGNF